MITSDLQPGKDALQIAAQLGKLSSEGNGGCLAKEPYHPGSEQGETVLLQCAEPWLNLELLAVLAM